VGVVGRGQGNSEVLADLLDTLEQDLKKLLIRDKLRGGREGGGIKHNVIQVM
jgi:hypothetical protein